MLSQIPTSCLLGWQSDLFNTVHMRYAYFIHQFSSHMCKYRYVLCILSSYNHPSHYIWSFFINIMFDIFNEIVAIHYWPLLYNFTYKTLLFTVIFVSIVDTCVTDWLSSTVISCHIPSFYYYHYFIMLPVWRFSFLQMNIPTCNYNPLFCYYCSLFFIKHYLYFHNKNLVGFGYADEDISSYNINNNSKNIDNDKMVVNLSDTSITMSEKKLLARCLKFCPNPGEPDYRQYKDDLDAFHLKLKRELYLRKLKTQLPAMRRMMYPFTLMIKYASSN